MSEYDLIERGPGDFLGEQQSGFLQFKFIDLLQDQDVIEQAQIDVNELIHQSDFLTNTKYKYLNRFMKDA